MTSKPPQRTEPPQRRTNPKSSFAPDPAGSLLGPIEFAEFLLIEQLGRGGFGRVYRAIHKRSGEQHAIKILADWRRLSSAALDRFAREARIGAALSHRNVRRVLDLRHHRDTPFIVMEYVDGPSLSKHLLKGSIPGRTAAKLVAQVADAVAHAHAKQILHRDIKPGNVIIEHATGRPVLIDFGLAKDELDEHRITMPDDRIGTLVYMTPEQTDGTLGRISARTDVYGLGVTLYECLTGVTPFPRPDRPDIDVVTQIQRHRARKPSSIRSDIHADLDLICDICLRKFTDDRYPSPAALAEELRRFVDGKPVRGKHVSRLKRARRVLARRPAESFGVLVLVLLALGGGIFAWYYFLQFQDTSSQLADVAPKLEAATAKVTQEQELREDAEAASAEAEAARDQARQAADARRRTFAMRGYAKDMQEIARSWEAGDLTRVRHALDRSVAKTPGDDLRGFEWYYWDRRLNAVCDRYVLQGDVRGVATSLRGDVLLGATDRWAVAWDTRSQRELFRHRISSSTRDERMFQIARQQAAVSPDGDLFAVTYPSQKGGELRVWNRAGDTRLTVSRDHRLSGYAVAFSPDGTHVVVSGLGGEWVAWSTSGFEEQTPECKREAGQTGANPHLHPTTTLWFVGDRELHVFSGKLGDALSVWAWKCDGVPGIGVLPTGVRPATAVTPSLDIVALGFEPGTDSTRGRGMAGAPRSDPTYRYRDQIVAGGENKIVRTWVLSQANDALVPRAELRGATGNILAVSRAGDTTVAACDDNTICVWPARFNAHIEKWPGDAPSRLEAVRRGIPTDRDMMEAIRTGDDSVIVDKSRRVDRIVGDSKSSPSGRFKVEHDVETGQGCVTDERGQEHASFKGRKHGFGIHPIRWSADERYVAIACPNQGVGLNLAAIDRSTPSRLVVLDLVQSKPVAEFTVESKCMPVCEFSPDAKQMCVSVSSDSTELWSLPGATQTQAIGFRGEQIVFSDSGKLIAMASPKETRVWNMENGSWSHQGKPGASRLVFTPNEKTLICVPDLRHTRLVLIDVASGDDITAIFPFPAAADVPIAMHGERLYTWSGSALSVYWADMIEEGPLLESNGWTNLPDDPAQFDVGLSLLLTDWRPMPVNEAER